MTRLSYGHCSHHTHRQAFSTIDSGVHLTGFQLPLQDVWTPMCVAAHLSFLTTLGIFKHTLESYLAICESDLTVITDTPRHAIK